MSNTTKAAEIIAEAATPAVETALQIGEVIAENMGKPVEVVFEVIQKTPPNTKKLLLIGAAAVILATTAGAGYYLYTRKKKDVKVIDGETVIDVDEELDKLVNEELDKHAKHAETSNGSKKK